jgi:hypothetical protein
MEWLGTKFAITMGTVRLRVRIALEDVPPVAARSGKAGAAAREERGHDGSGRRTYRLHPR